MSKSMYSLSERWTSRKKLSRKYDVGAWRVETTLMRAWVSTMPMGMIAVSSYQLRLWRSSRRSAHGVHQGAVVDRLAVEGRILLGVGGAFGPHQGGGVERSEERRVGQAGRSAAGE